MKKFFAVFIAFSTILFLQTVTHTAQAQITRQITIAAADDTLTNTDTANVTLVFDQSWKSVEVWVKEVSGTTGGSVYFMGEYLHGTDFVKLDSLTLSDVTTAQYKLITVPTTRLYKSFKLQYLHAGTGVMEIKAYYVRYTGGAILHIDPNSGLADLFKPGNQYRDLSRPSFTSDFIRETNVAMISERRYLSKRKRPLTI